MAPVTTEKTKQMQDEMDRFEAEILGNVGSPREAGSTSSFRPRSTGAVPPPPSSATFMRGPEPGRLAPPPPPPRNLFMPAQLLRPRNQAPPPPPSSNFTRQPSPMMYQDKREMMYQSVSSNFPQMMPPMFNQQQQFAGPMMPMGPIGPVMMPEMGEPAQPSEPPKLVISAAPQRYDKTKGEGQGESGEPAEKRSKFTDASTGEKVSEAKAKPGGSTSGAKGEKQSKKKQKKFIRVAGGTAWEDPSLQEWDPNDFRIFCGDLGNDVTDEVLARVFGRYPSFQKARVIRDKRTNKTKGFGFASFKDPQDFIRAMKEVNGKYVGSRPIKLRKSDWKKRNLEEVKKKEKEKVLLGM